jgi:protein-S-isoprenylcysteine O-methyltransferase Ste14
MAGVVRIHGPEPASESATAGRRFQAAWRPKLRLNYVTLAVIALFALILIVHAFSLAMTIPRLVGLSIFFPSFLLFVLARIQLGRAFSIEAKAEILVTTGLYSRIRNPIYVFGALMIVGAIVFASKPVLLLIFVVLIPLQIIRSRKEEHVLSEKFGDAYRDYKRQTWF